MFFYKHGEYYNNHNSFFRTRYFVYISISISFLFALNEYSLIGEWPNTYAYTKAIAEDTVRKYSVGLPTCIVRPSIIITTMEEPIPGWSNTLHGVMGIAVGGIFGLLRTLHCIPEYTTDIIPADYVIANIIVAGWDTAERR